MLFHPHSSWRHVFRKTGGCQEASAAGVLTVPYRRAVRGWRLSESKSHFAPAETERIPAAGYKAGPADQPFRRQNSVRERVLVIGHGVLVKRFAGVGLLGGWRRQAGGGIAPGAEVAEDLLDDAGGQSPARSGRWKDRTGWRRTSGWKSGLDSRAICRSRG
jgi:hypothetical protein